MTRVFTLVCVFAVLLHTGYCLTCYQCNTDKFNRCLGRLVKCPENYICFSGFLQKETNYPLLIERKCAPTSMCNQSLSFFNGIKIKHSSSCCSTENCDPSPTNEGNGLFCPSCSTEFSSECEPAKTIQCTGKEDSCFSVFTLHTISYDVHEDLTARGCVSSNLCNTYLEGTMAPGFLNDKKVKCAGSAISSNRIHLLTLCVLFLFSCK
ncbi:phospholipase A2 inhibitor subunit gamma B-like [Xenopus laevis]|uniref:Phospholipase A2 inhibitor subunit gamma B-like n=1 Tax=Xenopus laevis TaxID=8355 RepID=A0A8J1L7S6_XENLA|nr:phospholipase A2 inhibitor subunit gamma B-like [Xenopus laevis]